MTAAKYLVGFRFYDVMTLVIFTKQLEIAATTKNNIHYDLLEDETDLFNVRTECFPKNW